MDKTTILDSFKMQLEAELFLMALILKTARRLEVLEVQQQWFTGRALAALPLSVLVQEVCK